MAVANIDEVIRIIRASKDANEAREELLKRDWPAGDVEALIKLVDEVGNEVVSGRVKFTDLQARAILEMKLARLTGLEKAKIDEELQELSV